MCIRDSFEELVKLRIEEAKQISDQYSPWETLAQPFEPELTLKWLNKMFQPLKDTLPELIRGLNKPKKYDWDLSPESQHNLCSKLLDEFGRDEDQVVVGGQAGFAGHLRIGKGAKIAGQAGITKDVEPGAFLKGNPALPLKLSQKISILQRRLPELFNRFDQIGGNK